MAEWLSVVVEEEEEAFHSDQTTILSRVQDLVDLGTIPRLLQTQVGILLATSVHCHDTDC